MSGDLTEAMTSTRAILDAAVPQKAGADLCELASSLRDQRDALADALGQIKAIANRALHGDKSAFFDSLLAIRDLAHSAAGRLPCK